MHRNVKIGALFGALLAVCVLFTVGPAEAASTIARFVTSHDPASTSAGDAAIVCDVQNYESNELCFSLSTGTFKVDEDGDVTAASIAIGTDSAKPLKVAKVALAAVDTAGGLAAWTPGARKLLHHVVLDATTKSTAASTTDCGIAANATTLNDTLLDGADTGTAAALFDSSDGTDNGTNGIAKTRAVGATESVTCSVASGASAGIVGNLYVFYSDI